MECRNIYIAPVHVLCRDMLYVGKKRDLNHKACSDLDIDVVDTGITNEPTQMSYCFGLGYYGINLENPAAFSNIKVRAKTLSSLVGLFCFADGSDVKIPGCIKNIDLYGINDGARMSSSHIDMFENLYGHDFDVKVRYSGKYLSRVRYEGSKGCLEIHDSNLDYLYTYGTVKIVSCNVLSSITQYRKIMEPGSVNTRIISVNSIFSNSNVQRISNEELSIENQQ